MVRAINNDKYKGYILTEEDYKKIVQVQINGKIKYFLPNSGKKRPVVSRDELCELILKGMKKKDIAGFYGKSESWVYTELTKHFNTSCVENIKNQLEK